MTVRFATDPAPDHVVNEDYAFAAGALVGVLDGVSAGSDTDGGCRHGTGWYVRQLGGRLASGHRSDPRGGLPELLAAAIGAVRNDHEGQCDLAHSATPASTVCLLKDAGDQIEYLILGDSPLVLDDGEVRAVTDDRFLRAVASLRKEALTGRDVLDSAEHAERVRRAVELRRQLTNRPHGYWIAAADPNAAHHAVTGVASLDGPGRVRRAALLTDGASATVEVFALFGWGDLLDILTEGGPHELIRLVRLAERADRDGRLNPRYKRYDDATAALCLFPEEELH